MSFKSLCKKYFDNDNFYEILGINSTASTRESKYIIENKLKCKLHVTVIFKSLVKQAYHRLSLLVHPDRVDEDEKVIATEKFKALCKIHSILQDNDKRKLYDDNGEFDDEVDSLFNWCDYWRKMFKKIDIEDIDQHKEKYIGSETEIRDIKKAYVSSKGNMNTILEMVPFSNCDNEPRYIEIVEKMVENGEVERYEAFFNEGKQKKMRRRKKWEKEKKEAEKIDSKFLFLKIEVIYLMFYRKRT